jgi:coniferyl-aldehyde dehydrogenase
MVTAEQASPAAHGDELRRLFVAQRHAFSEEPDPALAVRLDRLARLEALIDQHEGEIVAAVAADFGTRPAQETRLAELFIIGASVRYARRRLKSWMRSRRVPTPPYLWPGRSRVVRQPVGVVGVIAPWNYPVQLALLPAVAALAAGNRVMLKPSELTAATAALLKRLVASRFAAHEFTVVNGGVSVGEAFARLPFDHLFFTGSTAVGRKIAMAAAANLTPLTLELGGKSPVIVGADADIGLAASRIVTGKLLNAGQTCIAPDYVLAPAYRVEALVEAIRKSVAARYPTLGANPDYASIIDDRHYARLTALVEEAVVEGARAIRVNPLNEGLPTKGRKFAPTLLLDVRDNMAVMREEIFGPVLPIEAYSTLDEAIAKINARPRPLALYAFGGARLRERVLRETIAGGVTLDDTLWHFCNEALPFGGVGASGMGAYHGERGFLAFTHEKAVFAQPRMVLTPLLSPPYGKRFEAALRAIKRLA